MKLIHTKRRFIKKSNQKNKSFAEKNQELPDYYQELSTDAAMKYLDKVGETFLEDAESVGWTLAVNEDAKLGLEKILDFNHYNVALTLQKKQTSRTENLLLEAAWQEKYDIYSLVVASDDMDDDDLDDEEEENDEDDGSNDEYDLDFGEESDEELDVDEEL